MTTTGARWIRAALQVNPFGYQGQNPPSGSFGSEADYNSALLDKCEQLGISLIAVTDHWCVDSALGLIDASSQRDIVALPGFEANSAEGVHLLVIFERGTEASAVNAAIGACGVEPGCQNGTTGSAFKEILDTMTDRGALVIPAHANVANRGMLMAVTGVPLVNMVTDPNLHAIAISPGQPEGTDQTAIEMGRAPYEREHPLAIVHADDIMNPAQLRNAGATSWFKVNQARLESIKLAVRTPQTRVALENPSAAPRTLLRRISWTGGFLDGVTIPISPDLTTLIGGRGTGKSTAIESLRYALGLEPIGESACRDHDSIIDQVVRSGTVVSVDVEVVSPTPQRFTIERTVNDPPLVRDAAGARTSFHPRDVTGLVEIFGQHELAELANDKTSVAKMVQRFAREDHGPDAERDSLLAELKHNREELERVEQQRARLEEELADITRLQAQVDQYNATDVPTRLQDMKRLNQDESVLTEAAQRVTSVRSALRVVLDRQYAAVLESEFDAVAGSTQEALLREATDAVVALAERLDEASVAIGEALDAADSSISNAKSAWDEAVREQRDGHSEVLRRLHEEGLEPDRYLDATRALEALRAREPVRATLASELSTLGAKRSELLGDLRDLERRRTEELHEAVRAANESTGGVVIVKPIAAPDRSHIMAAIGRHLSGQRTQISAAVEGDGFSVQTLVEAVREGVDGLAALEIRGAQATNLVAAGEPLLRELEELSVGLAVEVQLDIGAGSGSRQYKTIDELSKGQRATALLMLLLGASTAPLVIDQPEDDLDNRFVYEGVVTKLRDLKGKRQIIASTHNANVPVLGDAELIVALDGDGRQGWPVEDGVGSLDDAPIRSHVENILEGGPAAFNARQHLYGF